MGQIIAILDALATASVAFVALKENTVRLQPPSVVVVEDDLPVVSSAGPGWPPTCSRRRVVEERHHRHADCWEGPTYAAHR